MGIMSAAGGIVGAIGAESQGKATKAADQYQAAILRQNAQLSQQKGEMVTEAGEAAAGKQGLATRANVGQIKAAEGASNIDVNSGSAVKVHQSATELGMLDALTIRSNAARAAYGYQVEAQGQEEQATLEEAAGQYAGTAGDIAAVSSLLSGASSAGNQYARWSQLSGGGGGAAVLA